MTTPVEPSDSAEMRAAFEEEFQRDWNDPYSNDLKDTWTRAWTAARRKGDALLTEALAHVTPKPWDDDSQLHARISRHLGREVEYADWIAEAAKAAEHI